MKHFVLILSLFFFSLGGYAQPVDYNFGQQIPDVPQNACDNEAKGLAIFINDSGVNGQPTYYQYVAPPGIILTGPFTGSIADGTSNIAACQARPSGLPAGSYDIVIEASYDPTFTVDVISRIFVINVIDPVTATIQTPNGTTICDGNNLVLVADPGPGANPSYNWSTGATTSSIVVNTQGPYAVTITNQCGSDNDSQVIDSGSDPTLSGFTCTNQNNEADMSVTASNPGNLPLTFQWLEDGVPISNGGDFTIVTGTNTSSLNVINVSSNHQFSSFTCEVSNDCGDFTSPSCVTLPVELIYFAGEVKTEGIQLKWATATETDSDRFVVERSYDGRTFDEIGETPAAGFSQVELTYAFMDKSADQSLSQIYYRLKQIDFDGTLHYSDVVTVRTDGAGTFQLENVYAYGQEINLQFFMPASGSVTAVVYDLSGRPLYTREFGAIEGYNQQTLTDVEISSGFYILHLSNGFRTDVRKFVR